METCHHSRIGTGPRCVQACSECPAGHDDGCYYGPEAFLLVQKTVCFFLFLGISTGAAGVLCRASFCQDMYMAGCRNMSQLGNSFGGSEILLKWGDKKPAGRKGLRREGREGGRGREGEGGRGRGREREGEGGRGREREGEGGRERGEAGFFRLRKGDHLPQPFCVPHCTFLAGSI